MDTDKLDRILPKAKRVPLEDDGLVAYVFPIGLRQLRRFSKLLQETLPKVLAAVKVSPDADSMELTSAFASGAMPFVLDELLPLVADCIVIGEEPGEGAFARRDDVTLEDIAHWELPTLGEAWWQHSFGEERKRRPWQRVIEQVVTRITGSPFRISELFSRTSSSQDTPSTTSLNGDSSHLNPTGSSSRIEDGHSTSSPSGERRPAASSAE